MNKVVASIVFAIMASLTGCGTVQRSVNLSDPTISCIKTDHQSFLQYLYEKEDTPHVMIGVIDKAPTAGGAIYCVTPGKHKLGVIGYTKGYDWSTDIELDIKPGTKYWLRTSPSSRYIFQLFDVTNGSEVMVLEFRRDFRSEVRQ